MPDENSDDEGARGNEFSLSDDEVPEPDPTEPGGERSQTDAGSDSAPTGEGPGAPSSAGGGDRSSNAGDGSDEGASGETASEGSAPLSDLRADVEQRRADDDEDAGAFEELFTEMEVGGVDEDTVWDELANAAETPTVDPGSAVADEERVQETRDVTVVEKRLCHTCPHFADPPETACTHEGTTIEAEVDVDHFRVVDCPVVAEREAVDEMEASDFSADEP